MMMTTSTVMVLSGN